MKKISDKKPSSKSKAFKEYKRRRLDLKCLESGRYGVISSTEVSFPSHPVLLKGAIQQLKQAGADLRKVSPENAYGEVIVELPSRCKIKVVIPATNQGSLDSTLQPTNSVVAGSGENNDSDRQGLSIEESSLAEAMKIAEMASRISMQAVDVGHQLVVQAEVSGLDLESVVNKLTDSPDEKISRSSYGRASGQDRTIRYSAFGERTLGGNHTVAADVLSNETYSLSGCTLSYGRKRGCFILDGRINDPEWNRLSLLHLDMIELVDDTNSVVVELLGYAAASECVVDIDICMAEKVSNKRRWFKPLAIRNRSELIASIRDRMNLLEEV